MLKLVLPKGSLEKATLELFEAADLRVHRDSVVTYRASIDDPRIDEVRILRPQEIGAYVAEGLFDIGITGRDWVQETQADVVSLGELRYSKATENPVRIIVAVPEDSPWQRAEDLPQGVRVSSEYPGLTERFFADRGIKAEIALSYGATEAKVPDIVDCIVDITETGRAIRAAGLRDHRHGPHVLHRAGGQPGRLRRPAQGPRHGPDPHAARRRARGPGQGPGQAQRPGRPARRGDRPPARR